MTKAEQIKQIIATADSQGWKIEGSQNPKDGRQIVFTNGKKLHEGHLRKLCPDIFKLHANIAKLIEGVAPGRTCTHAPMRDIVNAILEQTDNDK